MPSAVGWLPKDTGCPPSAGAGKDNCSATPATGRGANRVSGSSQPTLAPRAVLLAEGLVQPRMYGPVLGLEAEQLSLTWLLEIHHRYQCIY